MDLPDTAAVQLPIFMPPPNATPHPRTGAKYRAYTEEDMARAEEAITEEGTSLRQASVRFNVPKTTLAERLGDRRPKPRPRKADGENRQRTRYRWSEADMASAVEAVRGGDKTGDAARRFGVPASQLNARTRGRAPRDLRSEVSRLSLRQEGLLAEWAAAQGALGCPPTKDEVFRLAGRALRKQQQQQQQQEGAGAGVDRGLGKQWIVHWMRRYPDIEILEWEPREEVRGEEVEAETKKKNGGRRAEQKQMFTFAVSTFEPVVGLRGSDYGAAGAAETT